MKAYVKTTAKATFTILATMTLVVACGSKKSKPADEAAGPQAQIVTTSTTFDGINMSCSKGGVDPSRLEGVGSNHLNINEKKEYTYSFINDGKTIVDSGTYEIVPATASDASKGKLTLNLKTRTVDGKNVDVVATSSQFDYTKTDKGLEFTTTAKEGDVCPVGETVTTKFSQAEDKKDAKTDASGAPAAPSVITPPAPGNQDAGPGQPAQAAPTTAPTAPADDAKAAK